MTEVAELITTKACPCDNGADTATVGLISGVPGPAMWRPRSVSVGLSFVARQGDKSAQIRGEKG